MECIADVTYSNNSFYIPIFLNWIALYSEWRNYISIDHKQCYQFEIDIRKIYLFTLLLDLFGLKIIFFKDIGTF